MRLQRVRPQERPLRSAAGQPLQMLWVSGTFHLDLCGGALDLAEIVRGELEFGGTDVLVEALQLPGAGNRDYPGLLSEQPGQRDLSRRGVLACCNLAKQFHQGLVRSASFRSESRDGGADVGTVEGRALIHLPGEEAFPQRAERHKADAELLEGWQDLLFRRPRPQRVLALHSRDRLDR